MPMEVYIKLDTRDTDVDYTLEEFRRFIQQETFYKLVSIKVSSTTEFNSEPPCLEQNQ